MPATIISVILLCCVLYAVVQVATSGETTVNKVVWILLIAVLPLIGFVIWMVAGPRTHKPA